MQPKYFCFVVMFYCMVYIHDAFSSGTHYVGIRNGERANSTEFPYQVALKLKDSFYCSGILISDRYVLTAAYCVPHNRIYHADISALVGTNDLKQGGRTYQISKAVKHERYNFLEMDYDIGLMKLATPVVYTPGLQSAVLADRGPIFKKGMRFRIAGWGWTSMSVQVVSRYLLQSTVLWMDQYTCRQQRQNSTVILTYRQFCSTMDNSPCMMDNGGPVTLNGTVIGIISGASWLCELYPPVYTKVSVFRDWISETIQELDRMD